MSAPTPAPWHAVLDGECTVRAGGRVLFYGSVGNYLRADVDAAHIVRCVNAHDAFVAAAEAALAYDSAIRLYADQLQADLPPRFLVEAGDLDLLYAHWIDTSRTALAKVRT